MESTHQAPEASVLVVDDDTDLLQLVERRLGNAGFRTVCVESAAAAMDELRQGAERFDVVLTDLVIPGVDGLELTSAIRAQDPQQVIILMTGQGTVDNAVAAMKRGAYDFLVKPFDPPSVLVAAIQRGVSHHRLLRRNSALEAEVSIARRFDGFIGGAPAVEKMLQLVQAVAPTDVTVLINGESGTGKELIARSLHQRSNRASARFVAINCAALGESVLESELFGHVRGAFTGAVATRRGLFEEASSGTLFLDEVGELSPATQVRLLRVLQEGEIRPVGSNESRKVDVRVVSATHRSLQQMVQQGSFREDLYYRLNVVAIQLPPLRDRLEDLPSLMDHFIRKHATQLGREPPRLDDTVLALLGRYGWPGNVRQLENVIQRCVVLAADGVIREEHLPPELAEDLLAKDLGTEATSTEFLPPQYTLAQARVLLERRYVTEALQLGEGNASEAARLAGMDRSNFRKLLVRHGLVGEGTEEERGPRLDRSEEAGGFE